MFYCCVSTTYRTMYCIMKNLTQLKLEKKQYSDDTFFLNTEKPPTFLSKVKNKLKSIAKPFSLGFGAFFVYEGGFNLVSKLYDLMVTGLNQIYQIHVFAFYAIYNWLNSINLLLTDYFTKSPITHDNTAKFISQVIDTGSYLAFIYFSIAAAIHMKKYNESNGKLPLSKPITYAVIGFMCLLLPTLMDNTQVGTFQNNAYSINTQHTPNTNNSLFIKNKY